MKVKAKSGKDKEDKHIVGKAAIDLAKFVGVEFAPPTLYTLNSKALKKKKSRYVG